MDLKIYSWNVLCFNTKLDEIDQFIQALDFDVLCMQEVTEEMLTRFKAMPFHLSYHTDVIRLYSQGKSERNYVVILSKRPIVEEGNFQFPDFKLPFHTRLFIRFMGILKWAFISDRGAVYADIVVQEQKVRIFSVHYTLWGPSHRANEFAITMHSIDPEIPTIIAGDFNVIEYPPMKILNWLLGSKIREALPTFPERQLFQKRFAAQGFKNPLLGKITHDFSHSQLDHVLVAEGTTVLDAFVVPELHGSDHHPVGVKLALPIQKNVPSA